MGNRVETVEAREAMDRLFIGEAESWERVYLERVVLEHEEMVRHLERLARRAWKERRIELCLAGLASLEAYREKEGRAWDEKVAANGLVKRKWRTTDRGVLWRAHRGLWERLCDTWRALTA